MKLVLVLVVLAAVPAARPAYGWRRPWWPPTPLSPPPPAPQSWWCNRTFGEEGFSADDVDCPPPPATPSTNCHWPCSVVTTDSATTNDHECRAQLAAINNCEAFVTGDDDKVPAVTSPCCAGLRSVLNSTGAAVDTAAGDTSLLKCVCALFLGDAHGVFPKPMAVERVVYLPVACSTALPPELFYVCYSGQVAPSMATSFSEP